MIFTETPLTGAYVIELEGKDEGRGFFARFVSMQEFAQHGLEQHFVQTQTSLSVQKGTLRGLHYAFPVTATKLMRCIRGALYDVIVDLRLDSPTFGKHFSHELSAQNRQMLYIPKGFAHGFMTLEDHTEALCAVSEYQGAAAERGIRWNDPYFKIQWPMKPAIISERDQQYLDFDHLHATPVSVS